MNDSSRSSEKPKLRLTVAGNHKSATFDFVVTNIAGYIDTNKLLINNASVNVKTQNYMTNYVNTLTVHSGNTGHIQGIAIDKEHNVFTEPTHPIPALKHSLMSMGNSL